jgi:glycerol-3-phosphate dehydrogenase (NAD(P)+)
VQLGHVAEGVNTARELQSLAERLGVEMPITRAVCRVLKDHTQARSAADELLQREPKSER